MGATDKRGSKALPGDRPSRSLKASEPAEPNAIPLLRRRAGAFASANGAGPDLIDKIQLAVSEAVTNVVKYAYEPGDRDGRVELTAAATREWVEIRVLDTGCGFRPGESDGLGIGLTLVAQMSGDLEIAQSPRGTTVTMRFPLASDAEPL